MADLRRLLQRLSALQPQEIPHRIGEQLTIRRLQAAAANGSLLRRYEALDPGAYDFCTAQTPRLPTLPFDDPPLDPAAAGLLQGVWPALGFDWKWTPEGACWHVAPDTGRRWPAAAFFSQINYRDQNPYGDVRVAWEPARLQQLISLALLAKHRTELRVQSLGLLVDTLESWVDGNPPARGIHYISVMECALRILSVTHALDIARPYLSTNSSAWRAGARLVLTHARMIEGRLSLHSSSGNHTIAECAGLVYTGLLFPEMKNADRKVRTGLKILRKEAGHQVLRDGGGAERSPGYHRFVIDLLTLVREILVFRHKPVPPEITEAVNRGEDFLSLLQGKPGCLPPINDSDNGFALSPHLRLPRSNRAPENTLITFPETGLSRVSLGRERDTFLLFDHGPMGLEPLLAHAHADALSLYIEINGRPFATDPGTYMYTGGGEWRRYFRSTRAHNTVWIDGRDQAKQATPFQWVKPCASELIRSQESKDGTVYLLARHHGYASRHVMHWRGIVCVPDEVLIIGDFIRGRGTHTIDLHWHLAVEPTRQGDTFTFEALGSRALMTLHGGHISVHRGELSPILGWASGLYGRKDHITTLRLHHQGNLPHDLVTTVRLPGWADQNADITRRLDLVRSWIP